MEIIAAVAGIAAIYFLLKYLMTSLSMMAYIYWTVEKKHAQPTKEELEACKHEIIRQMFRRV